MAYTREDMWKAFCSGYADMSPIKPLPPEYLKSADQTSLRKRFDVLFPNKGERDVSGES